MLNAQCRMLNAECNRAMLNAQCRMLNAECNRAMLNAQCRMLNAECSMSTRSNHLSFSIHHSALILLVAACGTNAVREVTDPIPKVPANQQRTIDRRDLGA